MQLVQQSHPARRPEDETGFTYHAAAVQRSPVAAVVAVVSVVAHDPVLSWTKMQRCRLNISMFGGIMELRLERLHHRLFDRVRKTIQLIMVLVQHLTVAIDGVRICTFTVLKNVSVF